LKKAIVKHTDTPGDVGGYSFAGKKITRITGGKPLKGPFERGSTARDKKKAIQKNTAHRRSN